MIKSIEIENFRCFEQTTISGFSRVNLISGLNNSGKTALLEALYLSNYPSVNAIMFLRGLRREELQRHPSMIERIWNSFFYHAEHEIKIKLNHENEDETVTRMLMKKVNSGVNYTIDKKVDDTKLIDLRNLPDEKVNLASLLQLEKLSKDINYLSNITATQNHVGGSDNFEVEKQIEFVPTSFRLSNPALAQEYDKAFLGHETDYVLEAVKIIDPSIEQIRTLNFGTPVLYLKRSNEPFISITLFGEAINRIVEIISRLINGKTKTLLIDEIENGFHYSKQAKLWRMLFKLAAELQIQIFATTHSLEMIQAFRDVALMEENEGLGAYFELARHVKTGRIVGLNHKLSTLDYALEQGLEVRGEERFNRGG